MTGQASTNPYQYTGRENDPTALYFYRARYYSTTFGRFISEDPIGLLGGNANLYGYAYSDLLHFTDATGRCPWCVAIAIGAGVGGAIEGYKAYEHRCRGRGLAKAIGRGALAGGLGAGFGLAVGVGAAPVIGAALDIGAGSTGAALAAGAVGGAAGGAANVAVNEGIATGTVNGQEIAEGAAVGALSGAAGVALGPEVKGGQNFNPFTSPRTFGPRAIQLYTQTAIGGGLGAGANLASADLSGRKNACQ